MRKPTDLAFNIIFTVEMLLRMLAAGGPIAYLKVPWNVFDFAMVLAGYTDLIKLGGMLSSQPPASSRGRCAAGRAICRALKQGEYVPPERDRWATPFRPPPTRRKYG